MPAITESAPRRGGRWARLPCACSSKAPAVREEDGDDCGAPTGAAGAAALAPPRGGEPPCAFGTSEGSGKASDRNGLVSVFVAALTPSNSSGGASRSGSSDGGGGSPAPAAAAAAAAGSNKREAAAGTAAPWLAASVQRAASAESSSLVSVEWHDARDDWWVDLDEAAAQDARADGAAAARVPAPPQGAAAADGRPEQLAGERVAALPEALAGTLRQYMQGRAAGCKALAALLHHMHREGLGLGQMRVLLAPMLQREAAALATAAGPDGGAAGAPAPVPQLPPPERTAALRAGAGAAPGSAPSLERLLANAELARGSLAAMSRRDGFRQVAWGQLSMWYCHDRPAHSRAAHRQVIKAQVALDEPLERLVCLARECDLVTLWNPAMSHMTELAAWSPAELLVYLLMWAPWPLPAPDVVVRALGVDLLDGPEPCVLLAMRSEPESLLPPGAPLPEHPRSLRLSVDAGGFKFEPLPPAPGGGGAPRTLATVLVSVDASAWALPDAVISFVLKVFAPLVLKSVLRVLQRAFRGSGGGAGSRRTSSGSGGAEAGGGALSERLAVRPEYAALAARARACAARPPIPGGHGPP